MHIEHGSWHGPILDYYNMAFYVQILQIFRAFLGELLAMQRPITDFGILGMTQADLWKTYPIIWSISGLGKDLENSFKSIIKDG